MGAVMPSRSAEPAPAHTRVIGVVGVCFSLLPQWSDLDSPAGGGRMSGGDINGFVDARALDDVEAAYLFFGFGERAIGYQHLAVADADGAGSTAWPEPRAAAPDPPRVHLRIPGLDLRQGVHLGGAQDHRFVIADHQQVLHGPPLAGRDHLVVTARTAVRRPACRHIRRRRVPADAGETLSRSSWTVAGQDHDDRGEAQASWLSLAEP